MPIAGIMFLAAIVMILGWKKTRQNRKENSTYLSLQKRYWQELGQNPDYPISAKQLVSTPTISRNKEAVHE